MADIIHADAQSDLLLGLPPLVFQRVLEHTDSQDHLSLFRSLRSARDLVLQHARRLCYRPASSNVTVKTALARAGGELAVTLDISGSEDGDVASFWDAAVSTAGSATRQLRVMAVEAPAPPRSSAAWAPALGTAFPALTTLQLHDVALTNALWHSLAACSQLSTLHLTGTTCMEAPEAPGAAATGLQAIPDGALLLHVTELRMDSPSLIPVLNALAPQLRVLQMGQEGRRGDLKSDELPQLVAVVARCAQLRAAHLYAVTCGLALFHALLATPVQYVSLLYIYTKPPDSLAHVDCRWHLRLRELYPHEQLHRLPLASLSSLKLDTLTICSRGGAAENEAQTLTALCAMASVKTASLGTLYLVVGRDISPDDLAQLAALRSFAPLLKPRALEVVRVHDPGYDWLSQVVDAFAGHLYSMTIRRPAPANELWAALQQLPPQQLAALGVLKLRFCKDVGKEGLISFAAALQPRPHPLVIQVAPRGEEVVAAVREVQAVLQQKAAVWGSRVVVETVQDDG